MKHTDEIVQGEGPDTGATAASTWRMVPPEAHHAATVAHWARSSDEAAAWVTRAEHPFPPAVVAAWWNDRDVHPWLLTDPDGVPVAYGEIWDDEDEDEVELARLIVDPDRRREGAGRRLIAGLVTLARQGTRAACFVRVSPDNTGALALYRSTGFVDVDPALTAAWNRDQPRAYVWLQYLGFRPAEETS